jgi:hypothetical protein
MEAGATLRPINLDAINIERGASADRKRRQVLITITAHFSGAKKMRSSYKSGLIAIADTWDNSGRSEIILKVDWVNIRCNKGRGLKSGYLILMGSLLSVTTGPPLPTLPMSFRQSYEKLWP